MKCSCGRKTTKYELDTYGRCNKCEEAEERIMNDQPVDEELNNMSLAELRAIALGL